MYIPTTNMEGRENEASKLAEDIEEREHEERERDKKKEMGFMYGVVKEQVATRKLKMKMKAKYYVPPAGPIKWKPPPYEVAIDAIGDQSRLTSGMKEVYNGNSALYASCPSPWDDEFLAIHGDDTHGQTFQQWMDKTDKRIPCGEARSHIYICPVGSDYSPLLIKSILNVVSAFCHGCRVHELPFVPIDPSWYYNVNDWMSDSSGSDDDEEDEDNKTNNMKNIKKNVKNNNNNKKYDSNASESDDDDDEEEEDERTKWQREIKEKLEKRKKEEAAARKVRSRRRKKMAARSANRIKVCAGPILDYLKNVLKNEWHGADNAYMVLAISMHELVDPHSASTIDIQVEAMQRKASAFKVEKIEPHRKILAEAIMKGKEARDNARAIEKELAIEYRKFTLAIEKLYKDAEKNWEGLEERIDVDDRVGILSFKYLDPLFGLSNEEKERANSNGRHDENIGALIRRACKRMTHTFGHLFGMEHCIYYHCRMNGCISIDEQETSPVYLCPVCLRKLHNACGIHTTRRVMERYYENRKFYGGIWRKAFPDVEDWYKERVARIDNAL